MVQTMPIRVLLVDDHDIVRSGLSIALEYFDDLNLVGEASNGNDAIKLCEECNPDVVLMDLMMPGMDGVAATQLIRQNFSSIRVVALTSFEDKELIQSAKQAGISAYLLKNVSVDELADAIRNAYRDKPFPFPSGY